MNNAARLIFFISACVADEKIIDYEEFTSLLQYEWIQTAQIP